MFKFFRRIRQQLLNEGRIKKYLLYAIGEIFLVMIGILMALQVNEWNNVRKERALEGKYYCKILEDLQQDVNEIEEVLIDNEERLKYCDTLLHLVQQEKPDRIEMMNAMFGSTRRTTYTFKPSMAAFEDIKSSGNLNILRDVALKDSLINYYSVLQGYVDIIDVNSDFTVGLYYDNDKDVSDLGWHHLPFARMEIDSSLVDIEALDKSPYPSPAARKQLTSDAVFYLTTNSRKKTIYKTMSVVIHRMHALISKKCQE